MTTEPTFKERNLGFLLLKTLADVVKTEQEAGRAAVLPALLENYRETGSKTVVIHIPGAEKVAQFTLAEPKPSHKIDAEELLRWCEWHRPDLVEEIEHPAVEAWTERKLRADVEKVISKEYNLATNAYINDDGEEVEGITYVPAAEPKSFTVSYEGGKEGVKRIIEAYLAGELPNITPGAALPAIGGAQ
jgi:hypothetical protein